VVVGGAVNHVYNYSSIQGLYIVNGESQITVVRLILKKLQISSSVNRVKINVDIGNGFQSLKLCVIFEFISLICENGRVGRRFAVQLGSPITRSHLPTDAKE
jgi:hypothetical protein